MTESELRRHLHAVHFMRAIGLDWPAARLAQAHGFAHRAVHRQDHHHD